MRRCRMIKLRVCFNLACGLTQLAAHLDQRPPRELIRYCTKPNNAELADLVAFLFQPNTENKAHIAEQWFENVWLYIVRNA